jgi:tRNA A-37 threonylcarbamoyl transferase component Bud32
MDVGDVIDSKYELVRLLGEGGMASVFATRHLRIGRQFAIKILHRRHRADPVMVERFFREARAAAAIGSPHIVEVTDAGETPEGIPYLVMEYLEGRDLATVLQKEGWLSPQRAVALVLQVCHALVPAHGQGIIHRDLKPENIHVLCLDDGSEQVKVLDFGIALLRQALGTEPPRLTMAGQPIGTPWYMAPEQARGLTDLDQRVDVYALGVVLYEALAGTLPFQGQTLDELLQAITTADPIPLQALRPELEPALVHIVGRAMAREPNDRYPEIADLASELQEILGEAGLNAPALCAPAGENSPADVPNGPSLATAVTVGMGCAGTRQKGRGWLPPWAWVSLLAGVGLLWGTVALVGLPDDRNKAAEGQDVPPDNPARAATARPQQPPASGPEESSRPTAAPEQEEDSTPHEGQAEASSPIQLKINIQPPSARLRIDEREVKSERRGVYVLRLARDENPARLEASAPGHRKRSIQVTLDRDQELTMTLAPRAKRASAPQRELEQRKLAIDSTNPYRRSR